MATRVSDMITSSTGRGSHVVHTAAQGRRKAWHTLGQRKLDRDRDRMSDYSLNIIFVSEGKESLTFGSVSRGSQSPWRFPERPAALRPVAVSLSPLVQWGSMCGKDKQTQSCSQT